MSAGVRAILTAAFIVVFGIALMISQYGTDYKKSSPEPSSGMRTALQPEPTGKIETFGSCDEVQMPCIDQIEADEWHLFESVPGNAANETNVAIIRQYKKNGKTFYEVVRF